MSEPSDVIHRYEDFEKSERMSDLTEAIEHPDDYGVIRPELLDAARRVLEGEQVQWCETHNNWPGHRQDTTSCSIVPKLLVSVEED